jgi:lipopolysaccharide/colanic/teichoic acid biosynthesis glycosyltransferase
MAVNAAADGNAVWAARNDPRITTIGKIIRKVRIDELPQIINVVKGEMSFVGPRPERPEFVAELTKRVSYYSERHRVKPGITGWAQLQYIYSDSIEGGLTKLQYDLYYVRHYSLLLYLFIVIQTARVILWPSGVR